MPADLHTIILVGVPVSESKATESWFEGLTREFAIIATDNSDDVPTRLLRFVAETEREFADFSGQGAEEIEAAWARGDDAVDLEITLPAAAAGAAETLLAHIRAANDFCRSGDLLTLEAPPGVMHLLEWYLAEIPTQINGGPVTPFPKYPASS